LVQAGECIVASMKKAAHIFISLFFLYFIGMQAGVEAISPPGHSFTADEARDARKSGHVLGASEIMRIVQRRYPNLRAADAHLTSFGRHGPRYRVKMLSDDGRVVEVTVDAQTGRILGTRGN